MQPLDDPKQARINDARFVLETALLALPIAKTVRLDNGCYIMRTDATHYAVGMRTGLTAQKAINVITDASFYDRVARDELRRRLQLMGREEL